jgi:hypothetical protein
MLEWPYYKVNKEKCSFVTEKIPLFHYSSSDLALKVNFLAGLHSLFLHTDLFSLRRFRDADVAQWWSYCLVWARSWIQPPASQMIKLKCVYFVHNAIYDKSNYPYCYICVLYLQPFSRCYSCHWSIDQMGLFAHFERGSLGQVLGFKELISVILRSSWPS